MRSGCCCQCAGRGWHAQREGGRGGGRGGGREEVGRWSCLNKWGVCSWYIKRAIKCFAAKIRNVVRETARGERAVGRGNSCRYFQLAIKSKDWSRHKMHRDRGSDTGFANSLRGSLSWYGRGGGTYSDTYMNFSGFSPHEIISSSACLLICRQNWITVKQKYTERNMWNYATQRHKYFSTLSREFFFSFG